MAPTVQTGQDLERLADEERLARSAADGDGGAFATLYDRYESRIFNYCHRLLGGGGDDAADATQEAFFGVLQRLPGLDSERELNFSAYLYTAARNASYDMIGRRKRAQPVDEIPEPPSVGADGLAIGALDEDPERAALLASFQEEVREASARLPERQREVLALRELDELSYDDIAGIMDMNRNSVAQLISRARIKLRDELRGSALAAIAVSSPECERALPLLSMRQDGQLGDGEDRDWLEAHLATCETCRASVEAIEEAGVSYRVWAPVVPLAWLRQATIEHAGELVGADWSDVAGPPWEDEPDEADIDHEELGGEELRYEHAPRHPAPAGDSLFAYDHERQDEPGYPLLQRQDDWEGAPAVVDEEERRRRIAALIGGLVLLVVLIGGVLFVLGGGSSPETTGPKRSPAKPAASTGAAGAGTAAPASAPGKRKGTKKTKKEETAVPGVGSTAGPTTYSPSGSSVVGQPDEDKKSDARPEAVPTTPNPPEPDPAPAPDTPPPTTSTPEPTPDVPPVPTPDPTADQPPSTGTPDAGGSTPSGSTQGGGRVPGGP